MTLGLIGLQGLPAQTIHAGMDFVTSDRAPITVPSPIVTPGETRQPEATHACERTSIGFETRGKLGWV
jgi:hypothetical protein